MQSDARTAPFSAFIVAGTHSGVGKTSLTLGLIGALRRRGLTVQPYKVGPDFIDPLHHRAASGRDSVNLDGWMLDPVSNRASFARASADADVAIVEGVMGLFDGSEGRTDRGSAAELAKLLDLPVVLLVDAWAMARSAAAVVHGFATFDSAVRLAGVVLNRVGGPGHTALIRDALDGRVPLLGALPQTPEVTIAERHLGLHLPEESRAEVRERLTDLVEQAIDVDALLAATKRERPAAPVAAGAAAARLGPAARRARIGVARDEAFCFTYADNLRLLEEAGAELIEWSPLRDALPSGLDAVYLPGGYPELHAEQLAENRAARDGLRDFARAGGTVYGECGGLMYLGEAIEVDGRRFPVSGVFPYVTRLPAGLTIAYVEVRTSGGVFGPGRSARGHLFHHSELVTDPGPTLERAFELRTVRGEVSREGFVAGNVLATYAHLHFGSDPGLADAFVAGALAGGEAASPLGTIGP